MTLKPGTPKLTTFLTPKKKGNVDPEMVQNLVLRLESPQGIILTKLFPDADSTIHGVMLTAQFSIDYDWPHGQYAYAIYYKETLVVKGKLGLLSVSAGNNFTFSYVFDITF